MYNAWYGNILFALIGSLYANCYAAIRKRRYIK
jgi:hypothetical protein